MMTSVNDEIVTTLVTDAGTDVAGINTGVWITDVGGNEIVSINDFFFGVYVITSVEGTDDGTDDDGIITTVVSGIVTTEVTVDGTT
jgi:hypothetical protein